MHVILASLFQTLANKTVITLLCITDRDMGGREGLSTITDGIWGLPTSKFKS